MISATSASRYITSVSRYLPRHQSRSSLDVHPRSETPRKFAELAEAVPIDANYHLRETVKSILVYCDETKKGSLNSHTVKKNS